MKDTAFYDEALAARGGRTATAEEAFFEIAIEDLRRAADTFKKTSMAHLFNLGRRCVPSVVSLRSTRTGTHRRFTEGMLH